MAQTEDTELRDLVVEALEKNGSLAKIRALLRANIFLAFEDNSDNIKQNMQLDSILKLPEGALCLSLIHEFLEFCNLKNSLFVYMSESRQGKQYLYEGQKSLKEKLNIQRDLKEPLLITLLKSTLYQRKYENNTNKLKKNEKVCDNYRDDDNCTYIVHDDSSTTSMSQSDNSSDEKNKLHLRLQLDNSDTDTSSDSTRDKSNSEYIANEHILVSNDNKTSIVANLSPPRLSEKQVTPIDNKMNESSPHYGFHSVVNNNSSSDSTSYRELKSSNINKNMMNTLGIPLREGNENQTTTSITETVTKLSTDNILIGSNIDSPSSASVANANSSGSMKNSNITSKPSADIKTASEQSAKTDVDTVDYSFDFTTSTHKYKDIQENTLEASKQEVINPRKDISNSPNEDSQSSVSLSDVTDLISEKSNLYDLSANNDIANADVRHSNNDHSDPSSDKNCKKTTDDSGEFTDSPIPSLSNLSLDIHSD